MATAGTFQGVSARDVGVPSAGGERRRLQTEELAGEEQPTIAQLIGELVADAQHLIRKELELAKVEIESLGRSTVRNALALVSGISIAGAGGLLLLFMLVHLISNATAMELWLSYAIVGGASLVLGGLLLAVGRARIRNIDPVPRETMDALRKDAQWIREQNPLSRK
jgi:hypothetical protein